MKEKSEQAKNQPQKRVQPDQDYFKIYPMQSDNTHDLKN